LEDYLRQHFDGYDIPRQSLYKRMEKIRKIKPSTWSNINAKLAQTAGPKTITCGTSSFFPFTPKKNSRFQAGTKMVRADQI